jgi:hypothetical protein
MVQKGREKGYCYIQPEELLLHCELNAIDKWQRLLYSHALCLLQCSSIKEVEVKAYALTSFHRQSQHHSSSLITHTQTRACEYRCTSCSINSFYSSAPHKIYVLYLRRNMLNVYLIIIQFSAILRMYCVYNSYIILQQMTTMINHSRWSPSCDSCSNNFCVSVSLWY